MSRSWEGQTRLSPGGVALDPKVGEDSQGLSYSALRLSHLTASGHNYFTDLVSNCESYLNNAHKTLRVLGLRMLVAIITITLWSS